MKRFCMRTLTAVLITAIPVSGSQAQEPGSNPCPVDAEIWVLAGQSNMQGAGRTPDTLESKDIWMLNMDGRWIPAKTPIHRIYESNLPAYPIAKYDIEKNRHESFGQMMTEFRELAEKSKKDPVGGVGPGLYFARHVQKHTGRPIGLIPCAIGGSRIEQWDPAGLEQGDSSLYGAMIRRVRETGGKLSGFIWIQGESEAMLKKQDTYREDLLKLFDSFRKDVGDPNLPILVVQIGRFINSFGTMERSWEDIREIQRKIPADRENIYTVTGIDLPLDDCIHFSTDGNNKLGRRLGELALTYVYDVPGHGKQIDLESMRLMKDKNSGSWYLHLHYSGVTGRLKSEGLPNKFELRFGDEIRIHYVVNRAELHPEDPGGLKLFLSGLHEDQAHLISGPGSNPYMNITDETDMPLPAFGPLPVPLKPVQD